MIERIGTPLIGVAAIALVAALSLSAAVGSLAGPALFVIVAGGGLLLTRSRSAALGAKAPPVVERVGGCGLGPGVAVHAVRVANRVLVVGVSGSSIALLDTASVDEVPAVGSADSVTAAAATGSGAPPLATLLRRIGLALALTATLAGASASALAAQSDSTSQAADLGSGSRVDRQARRNPADPGTARPLELPPGPEVELPPAPATPLGPMFWLAGLALLPFAVMALTSFVKISVVLSLLRSALGTPQVPSDPLLAGIALALTTFVMAPVGSEVWGRVNAVGTDLSSAAGVLAAASAAEPPVRGFLERNARTDEVALFVSLSARNGREAADPGSLGILIPAFVTSELREAFIAGFFLFIPFLVVDLVVSNILMSMGMVMVSPTTVSLPFKILLFVLVDGWPLLAKALALSYH